MVQTRREFVARAAVLGAGATLVSANLFPARAAAGPVRISLSEFMKDDAKVAMFRKGVAAMKALPPSDHRSWFWWAATHAYNDAAYRAALKSDRALAKVDKRRYWNKCPHFGQSSADFLIWHRAYVFYFERVLRDATQDAAFALPYWDYGDPAARDFPGIFAPQWLDAGQTAENPLYNPNRELGFVSGRFELAAPMCEAQKTMAAANFFSAPGSPGFGGDILDSEHTQQGFLEQRPHNDIHIAVGGVVGNVNGAMADIPTSAFDPVFWVHHANVDRLWTVWAAMPGKAWGPLPPDSWLDAEPWVFMNVDGTEARESRRFYMDRANLDVRYDTDDPNVRALQLPATTLAAAGGFRRAPAPPRVSAARPGAAAPVAEAAAPSSGGGAAAPAGTEDNGVPADMMAALQTEFELAAQTAPLLLAPGKPATRRVVAAAQTRGSAVGGGALPRAASPRFGANQRVLLELSDISFDRVPSSGFAVYLDREDASPDNDKDFVGLIDLFGATHRDVAGMSGMKAVQRFDVTRLVSAAGGNYTLRVEPYALLVSKSGAPAPARADEVKIGGVKFLVVG